MIDAKALYQHGIERFSSEQALLDYLPKILSPQQLANLGDDRYLSLISQRVFRAGMTHAVVDKRWPHFEKRFWGFDPEKMLLLSEANFDSFMQDEGLIRHRGKMLSIPINAQMVLDCARQYGSFGQMIADWPSDNIIGLWHYLAKHGRLLGGRSAPAFLRMAGKDTFILTPDVCAALIAQRVVEQVPKTKADLAAVQNTFNQLQQQSALPLSHLSCLLALTVNQPY